MRFGAALVEFEQRYQLTEDTGDIAAVDFIDDQIETPVGLFSRILAETLENALA